MGKTIVMGASFRNTDEILELAGCDRLTMAPPLLEILSNSTAPVPKKLDATKALRMDIEEIDMNETVFRWMMNQEPMATDKLAEGIRGFAADIGNGYNSPFLVKASKHSHNYMILTTN